MPAPLISFIVAAYNAQSTLQRTLGSLATDADPSRYEVLVIDDGSTDGTARIAEGFCAINTNFRFFSQPNRGLGAVRNRGIELADGDFVTFCDSDDIFLPANTLRLAERTRAQAALVGVGLGFSLIENRAIEQFWDNEIVRVLKHLGPDPQRSHLKFLVQPSACPKVFDRRYVREAGLRFTEGRLFEDVEFTTGALLSTDRLCFDDLVLFIYDVRRKGSITTDTSARRFEILDNIEPLLARAAGCRLTTAQSLCFTTVLLRTALWCLDNLPRHLRAQFAARLVDTFQRYEFRADESDRRWLEPCILDRWDRRAFRVACEFRVARQERSNLVRMLEAIETC
jgi:glycosyltransferase involved in cell wall biosynthesis